MGEASFIQPGADRLHKAVHHVGRRDNIGAGFSLRNRCFYKQFQRFIIEDIPTNMSVTLIRMNHSAVTMVRKLTKAGVCNDEQIRISRFNHSGGFLNDAMFRKGRGPDTILRFRNTEQEHCRNTQVHDLLDFFLERV
ncbi:hypothetical protein D3C76_1333130 [compost metagenome]